MLSSSSTPTMSTKVSSLLMKKYSPLRRVLIIRMIGCMTQPPEKPISPEEPFPLISYGLVEVSYPGIMQTHFCEKDVKTSAKVYEDMMLEAIVRGLNTSRISSGSGSSLQGNFDLNDG